MMGIVCFKLFAAEPPSAVGENLGGATKFTYVSMRVEIYGSQNSAACEVPHIL